MHKKFGRFWAGLAVLGIWTIIIGSRVQKSNFAPIESHLEHAFNEPSEERNTSQLVARATNDDIPPFASCRYFCGQDFDDSSGPSNDKRSLAALNPNAKGGLAKRAFDEWPAVDTGRGSRNVYMRNAFDNLQPNEAVVPGWAEGHPGFNTIVTRPLGNQRFRFGMQQICGCTMLFVMSRRRVYLGHYWETVSFGQEANADYELDFNGQVLDFIRNGYTYEGQARQDSLAEHAADFTGHNVFAYIISPDRGYPVAEGVLEYPDKVGQMAAAVAAAINIPVQAVVTNPYLAVDKKKDKGGFLKRTTAGRMIYDYDPDGLGPGLPAWRVLWQNSQLINDQWLPGQEFQ